MPIPAWFGGAPDSAEQTPTHPLCFGGPRLDDLVAVGTVFIGGTLAVRGKCLAGRSARVRRRYWAKADRALQVFQVGLNLLG